MLTVRVLSLIDFHFVKTIFSFVSSHWQENQCVGRLTFNIFSSSFSFSLFLRLTKLYFSFTKAKILRHLDTCEAFYFRGNSAPPSDKWGGIILLFTLQFFAWELPAPFAFIRARIFSELFWEQMSGAQDFVGGWTAVYIQPHASKDFFPFCFFSSCTEGQARVCW